MAKFTSETARDAGRKGGRNRKGVPNKATIVWKDFCALVLTDLEVQLRILQDARAGKLPPHLVVNMAAHYAGRPPIVVQQATPPPDRAAMVARLRQLSKVDRMLYADLCRKMVALDAGVTGDTGTPALLPLNPVAGEPEPRVTIDVTPEATPAPAPEATDLVEDALQEEDDLVEDADLVEEEPEPVLSLDQAPDPPLDWEPGDYLPDDAMPAAARRTSRRAKPELDDAPVEPRCSRGHDPRDAFTRAECRECRRLCAALP